MVRLGRIGLSLCEFFLGFCRPGRGCSEYPRRQDSGELPRYSPRWLYRVFSLVEVRDPSVDVSQGVFRVQTNCFAVILYRSIVFLIVIVGESAVVEISSFGGIQPNRFAVVAYRYLVFLVMIVGESTIVKGVGVVRPQPDRLGIIANRLFILLFSVRGVPTRKSGFRVALSGRCRWRWQ